MELLKYVLSDGTEWCTPILYDALLSAENSLNILKARGIRGNQVMAVKVIDKETADALQNNFEAAKLCIFDIKEYLKNLPVDASRQQIKNGLLKLIN